MLDSWLPSPRHRIQVYANQQSSWRVVLLRDSAKLGGDLCVAPLGLHKSFPGVLSPLVSAILWPLTHHVASLQAQRPKLRDGIIALMRSWAFRFFYVQVHVQGT